MKMEMNILFISLLVITSTCVSSSQLTLEGLVQDSYEAMDGSKAQKPQCCDNCLCSRSNPPICRCVDIKPYCPPPCKTCPCTRSIPPQCRCLKTTNFCYPKCKGS